MVRDSLDPFSTLRDSGHGTRVNEQSSRIAWSLSVTLGEHTSVLTDYLRALSAAPPEHLQLLARRHAAIVFAPLIADALESDWAAERRGRPLSAREVFAIRRGYSLEAETAGIYDPQIDALVLPTGYAARDLERVVLHELGHALTMGAASAHAGLLADLPPAIARHIAQPVYSLGDGAQALQRQCWEVLAEGYVYLAVGKSDVLPPAVLSELIFILSTVSERERIRFDFDPETGRTATRVERSDIVTAAEDPGRFAPPLPRGHGLEPVPLSGESAEPASGHKRAA